MKATLLSLTQSVLRAINGAQINSISDTEEAVSITDIIKECYYDIISNADLPELTIPFNLTSSGNILLPVLMTIPDIIVGLEELKYDVKKVTDTTSSYVDIKYLPLQNFLAMVDTLDITDTSTSKLTWASPIGDNITFKFRNDVGPSHYTSLDDKTLLFDAYDSAVDSTLQSTKTKCVGIYEAAWSIVDTFIPALDAQQYNILLKEAKAMAFSELRQTQNVDAKKDARRGRILANSKKLKADYKQNSYYDFSLPNYGRK